MPAGTKPGVNPKRLRVLIADDVQETRRNTRIMLGMNPNVEVVAIARNGVEAVGAAKIHKPHLAILDVNMPELNGLAAYEAMRKENPNLACIIISAERDSKTFQQAIAVGVRAYLVKPFTVDELNAAVEKATQFILKKRADTIQNEKIRIQREEYLKRLANEYAKTRRTDDQAMEVFEHLAVNPKCELRYLRILAMIYVIRNEWEKLKTLADRLAPKEEN